MTRGVGGKGQNPFWQDRSFKRGTPYENFKTLCTSDELTTLEALEKGFKKEGKDFEKALQEKLDKACACAEQDLRTPKEISEFKNTVFAKMQNDLKLARQNRVSSIVTQAKNWEQLVDGVIDALEMEQFVKHAWQDEIVRSDLTAYENDLKQGWDHIKTTYAHEPALLNRFDKFRKALQVAMEKEINQALDQMNLPKMKWVAIGTAGAKSDIDLTANVEDPSRHSEKATSLAKVLFDAIFYKMAHDFSGKMIDLDTYTTHEGKVLKTPQGEPTGNYQLLHSEKAKGEYIATELFAGFVELRRNCHSDEEFDQRIKNYPKKIVEVANEVKRFLNEEQKKIDTLACSLEEKTDITEVSEEVKEKAFYVYKSSRILEVAEEMDRCSEEIIRLEQTPHPDFDQLDALRMKWNKLGVIRELYLPRGYKSKGAYLVVCERRGGQREQRGFENVINTLESKGWSSGKAPTLKSGPEEIIPAILENLGMYYHQIPKGEVSSEAYINASKYALRIIDELQELISLSQQRTPKDRRGEMLKSLLTIYGTFVSDLEIVKRERAIPSFVLEKELERVLAHEIERNAHLEMRIPQIISNLNIKGKSNKQVVEEFKKQFLEVLKEIDIDCYTMFIHPTKGEVDPLDVMFGGYEGEKDIKKFLLKQFKRDFPISGDEITFQSSSIEEKKREILTVVKPLLSNLEKQELTKKQIAEILKTELVKKGLVTGIYATLFNPELDRLIDAYVGVVNHEDGELNALKQRSKSMAIETFDERLKETLGMIKHTVTTLPENTDSTAPTERQMGEHLDTTVEGGSIEEWYKAVHPQLPLFELLEKLTIDVLDWSLETKVIEEPYAPPHFMEIAKS